MTKSVIYIEKDVTFNLEKVTDKNLIFWIKFLKKQKEISDDQYLIEVNNNPGYVSELQLLTQAIDGAKSQHKLAVLDYVREKYPKIFKQVDVKDSIFALTKALYFFDKAEVYIAYIGKIESREDFFGKGIEMIMSVTTSPDADFSTHMGILRIKSYEGQVHKDIAIKLHSFASQAILSLNKIPRDSSKDEEAEKEFMINLPNSFFKTVMIKEFEKQGKKIERGCSSQQKEILFLKENTLFKEKLDTLFKFRLSDLSKISGMSHKTICETETISIEKFHSLDFDIFMACLGLHDDHVD